MRTRMMSKMNYDGIKCPRCGSDCIFKWQEFKGGARHIRQECTVHGYLRYAPQIEPYITLADQFVGKQVNEELFYVMR